MVVNSGVRAAVCETTNPVRLLTLLLLASTAYGVDLKIQFGALERMLGEQVFTQDGRRYVHGTATTKCNFAYLEKPRVQGVGRPVADSRQALRAAPRSTCSASAWDWATHSRWRSHRSRYIRMARLG